MHEQWRDAADVQIPKLPLLPNELDPTQMSQAGSLMLTRTESQEGERLGSNTLPTSRGDISPFRSVKQVL